MKDTFDVVQTVCLTEKATRLSEVHNQYVFRVAPSANKIEIRKAIEALFKTKVVRVNTSNYEGKKKRERRPDFGRRPSWKKAIVTLKEGEKIDFT